MQAKLTSLCFLPYEKIRPEKSATHLSASVMLEHVFIHSLRKTVAGQNAPALSIKASDENIFKSQHFVAAQGAKISGFFKKKTPS